MVGLAASCFLISSLVPGLIGPIPTKPIRPITIKFLITMGDESKMSDQHVASGAAAPGYVANAVALLRGRPVADPLRGISPADLSSAEQQAVVEAKKRKNSEGQLVCNGSGSNSSGSNGVAGISKTDILALLAQQQDVANQANRMLLSEALDQTQARNSQLLATFGEGIQEQLGAVNDRVSNVEGETAELKSEVKQMRTLVAEVQSEQKRQAEVLLLAQRGGLTRAELDLDNFERPANLEIVQISSPKYVSLASVENAIKPHMVSLQIPDDHWTVVGNIQGKRFSIQFAQNAYTSAKLAQKVTKGLFVDGSWTAIYAETAKPDREGKFEQVKLFIGPDQSPVEKATHFMLKKFVEACETVHPELEFTFWKARAVVQVIWEGKKKVLSKMLPTASAVDETMVQWDPVMVKKFKKAEILAAFKNLVIDPIDATEWCV